MKKLDSMITDSATVDVANTIGVRERDTLRNEILYLVGAFVALISGAIRGSIYPNQEPVQCVIYLIGIAIIGIPIMITAIRGLVKNDVSASLELLVFIAIVVCIIDGQYVLALLIPIILTLVHFLEEKSIVGGRDAINSLKKIQLNRALLLVDGVETEVDAKTVKIGDVVVVKPGMAIPVDGIVISGASNVNQQSLTGESEPVGVEKGAKVFAGTVNIEGEITVVVEKEYKDSSFQQIVNLLDKTQNITMNETKVVDTFLRYYIPIILVIAIMVWLFTRDVSRAIAILVVSCPCGYTLVSSVPMISSFSVAAKRGILIKNANFINRLGDCNCVVFDKTGTITNGKLDIVGYVLKGETDERALLRTAALAAKGSLHPVSASIVENFGEELVDEGYEIKEVFGKGVISQKGDEIVYLGNEKWMNELGLDVGENESAEGSVTWVAKNDVLLGGIIFRDLPRADAPAAVLGIKELGIEDTVLLTGDKELVARRIMEAVGIDEMYSQMLPSEKLEVVTNLQKQYSVVVLGDGINDALALSRADVGIAMGAMGSETAIQSADIAFMSNNLANLPFIIALSRRTKKIVLQNIVIAFVISFVMLILAATGVVDALLGSILHNISAFLVLLNSGRLLKSGAAPDAVAAADTSAQSDGVQRETDDAAI